MNLLWAELAWDDYLYWQKNDRDILERTNELVKDTRRNPFKGIGKPEALKGELSGWWSRRISGEHRLVYRVSGKGETQQLVIAQCRYNY